MMFLILNFFVAKVSFKPFSIPFKSMNPLEKPDEYSRSFC